jgi:hypothetical protein
MIEAGWFSGGDLFVPSDPGSWDFAVWRANHHPECEAHDLPAELFGLHLLPSGTRLDEVGLVFVELPCTPRFANATLDDPGSLRLLGQQVAEKRQTSEDFASAGTLTAPAPAQYPAAAALSDRGLDPELCRLFIVDGAKALTKATRRTFGADIPIHRCQVHKACNITDRIDPKLHASVRRALRQAWEMDDCGKTERLLRNLTRRIELEAPGCPVASSRASTRSSP